VPLTALYGLASFAGWLTFRFFPYRERVIRENLSKAFPGFNELQLREVMRCYYLGFAQMLMEIIKSIRMPAAELHQRVRIHNLEAPRAFLAQGQPVLLVAAHQGNWEWMLLSLSIELGYPVDAAYKPLVNPWAEREMKKLRTRLVADQEPTTSERKHWTRFLGRDTAFYMGPEEIARVTHFPVFFIAMRRTARGYYEMEFQPLATGGEGGRPGELTERYARLVEQQIRAAPPDWPWSHKRWKLKRSLYQTRPGQAPMA
jgi:KDO2-lipid IV(A) lauroyltransferase